MLIEDRQKELENERSFWENLFAWLIATIMNIVSKRKVKPSDLLRKKDKGNDVEQFQNATRQMKGG